MQEKRYIPPNIDWKKPVYTFMAGGRKIFTNKKPQEKKRGYINLDKFYKQGLCPCGNRGTIWHNKHLLCFACNSKLQMAKKKARENFKWLYS